MCLKKSLLPNGPKRGRKSMEAPMKMPRFCTLKSFSECSCHNIQTIQRLTIIHCVQKMYYMMMTIGIALPAESVSDGIIGIVEHATNVSF